MERSSMLGNTARRRRDRAVEVRASARDLANVGSKLASYAEELRNRSSEEDKLRGIDTTLGVELRRAAERARTLRLDTDRLRIAAGALEDRAARLADANAVLERELEQVLGDVTRLEEERDAHVAETASLEEETAVEADVVDRLRATIGRATVTFLQEQKDRDKYKRKYEQSRKVLRQMEGRVDEWVSANASFIANVRRRAAAIDDDETRPRHHLT